MNLRLIAILVCAGVAQTVHAIPALEAGMVIFKARVLHAIIMASMQTMLSIITFLYVRGWYTTAHKHQKKIDAVCTWSVGYLAVSALAEVYITSFGSPLTDKATEFIAQVLLIIDVVATLHLLERLKPGKPTQPGTEPQRKPRPPKAPLPPRLQKPTLPRTSRGNGRGKRSNGNSV